MNIKEAIKIWDSMPILGRQTYKAFEELVASPFDAEVHYPIAYLYTHYIELDKAKQLLENAPKTDSTYQKINDFIQALEFAQTKGGIFPLSIPFSEWWDGPHLEFPKNYKGKPLTAWFPARLILIDGDNLELLAAKNNNEVGFVVMTRQQLNLDMSLPEGYKECLEDSVLIEVAIYGDSIISKHHDMSKPWEQPEELATLHRIVEPILEHTNERICEWANSFEGKA